MSRKLKFRAWDKGINDWHVFDEIVFKPFGDMRTLDLISFDGLVMFEQYAGRKDKHGVDLYENDIASVLIKNALIDGVVGGRCEDITITGPIEYKGCMFGIHDIDAEVFISLTEYSDIEVVGNIHLGRN